MIGPKIRNVLYQEPTLASDGQGGYVETWTTKSTLKGSLMVPTGNSSMQYHRIAVESTHKFYMDYPKSVMPTEKGRLVWEGRTFNILYVENPATMNVFLTLHLQELI